MGKMRRRTFLTLAGLAPLWARRVKAGDVSSPTDVRSPQSDVSDQSGVSNANADVSNAFSILPSSMWATPPDVFFNFTTNQAMVAGTNGILSASSLLTVTRASSKTNLFPTSASGFVYSSFGNNVASITSLGLSVEESRTNQLLNSTVPATQTTASLGTGTYTLWVNGSGSATSSAGSATITGAGAATNGTPNVFVVTVAGTVTITVAGSLNAFQCELGTFGTSLIVTAGATVTRASDVVTLTTAPSFGSAYSLFASGTPQAPAAFATNQNIAQIDDGTISNRISIFRALGGGNIAYRYSVAGPNVYATTSAAVAATGATFKTAIAAINGTQNSALNGTANSGGSGAGTITPTSVTFGANSTGEGHINQINGFLLQTGIWKSQALSSATLQAITT